MMTTAASNHCSPMCKMLSNLWLSLYTPTTPGSLYSMLVHLYEPAETDQTGTQMLGRLKGALATSKLSWESPRGHREENLKVMRELQTRKRMQRLQDRHGVMLTEARKIVAAWVEHWDNVSEKWGESK